MKKMRYGLIVLWFLLCPVTFAAAQVSIGIGLPNLSIGINMPYFPELVPVPGYPVYYAPQVEANYFFYDGMYWVYQDDNWYASTWYDGPWGFVEPEVVPLFVLRIPVRYYRQPPVYFRGWRSNAPPRWGQHWGRGWEDRRRGWDSWNRGAAPARAPRPVYQRHYSGDRYPGVDRQQALRGQKYRYQPRDKDVRQHYQRQVEQRRAPAQNVRQSEPAMRSPGQRNPQLPAQIQQGRPDDHRSQPPQRGGENFQRSAPDHAPSQQREQSFQNRRPQPEAMPREQPVTRGRDNDQRSQDRGEESGRGQGRDRDDDRGRGRN